MSIFTNALLASGLALIVSQASAQVLYDNFENTRLVTYSYVDGTLDQAATNPGSNAVNSSPKCGSYTRSAVEYDVVVISPTAAPSRMADVSAYAAGTKRMSMKFRSPGPNTAVQLVLQNKAKTATGYPNGNYGGTFNATTSATANTWETLTFTYTAGGGGSFDPTVAATNVDQLVMLIAGGVKAANTYYLDDVMGPELLTGTVAAPVLLDDFESTRLLAYPLAQGTLSQTAANPGSSTANSSATCASFARDATQQYATIVIQPKSGKFGDVSGYASGAQKMTLKFRSPAANTAVQLVLQNKAKTANNYPNGNYGGTFNATTSATANTWETLTFTYTAGAGGTFDPSVAATDVDQLALLIAPGATNNGATYYFDDLTGPALSATAATRLSANSTAAFAIPYPNPGTGMVRLPISLQKAAVVSLAVFDGVGRQVASVLESQPRAAGTFEAELNSAKLAAGLYTCRLTVDGQPLTRQLSIE